MGVVLRLLESLDLTGNDIAYVEDNFPPALSQLRLKDNRICNLAPSPLPASLHPSPSLGGEAGV